MTLIRSLPVEQFSAFRSSPLLLSDIKLSTLKEAFQLEEENRRPSASTLALSTSAPATAAVASDTPSQCHFCRRTGHFQADCSKYIAARRVAQDSNQNSGRRRRARGKGKAPSPSANQAEESVANASTSQYTPPLFMSSDWNADTGATSHMTQHRHWFKSYTPYVTPIRLANNHIIQSAGIGSVVFEPVLNGKKSRPIEFQSVLHVPELHSNLLSVLHLTCKQNWTVNISSNRMFFTLHSKLYFTATVNEKNTAYLDGKVVPTGKFAGLVSTCPLDISTLR